MVTDAEVRSWFIACTAASAEKRARDGLTEAGYEVFLPVETHWFRLERKKHRVHRPLLPGYVFVRCTEEDHYWIKKIDGVLGMMRGASAVARLDETGEGFLDELRADEAAGLFDYTRRHKLIFEPDQLVKITGGKFTGFTAKVLAALDDEEKIRVVMQALGRIKAGGEMDVRADQLEHIDPQDMVRPLAA